MDKDIVAIKIGFENCECTKKLTVPSFDLISSGADVYSIRLENVHTNISNCANNTKGHLVCDKARIALNPRALKKSGGKGMFSEGLSLGDRIAMGDICDIEVFYDNGKSDIILMPWGDDMNYNTFMKTKVDEYNRLVITVKKRKEK